VARAGGAALALALVAFATAIAACSSSSRPAAIVPTAEAGADAPAAPTRVVFVSKASFFADFGGIAPADAACRKEAAAAGLANADGFVAWLAKGGSDAGLEVRPAARVTWAGAFAVPSGRVVANDKDALFGAHLAFLRSGVDEEADGVPAKERRVWTGSTAGGAPQSDCANWTSRGAAFGSYGLSGHLDATWIFAGDVVCSDPKAEHRVYCVGN
jgi:hypothetical protein